MTRPSEKYDRSYRQKSERRGRLAERLAELVISLKGYQVLERRWKSKVGEIDLIAHKKGVLVFIEVKRRTSHEKALEAVNRENRRRIEQAANAYVSFRKLTPLPPFRFDIFTVSGLSWQHLPNAWRGGD